MTDNPKKSKKSYSKKRTAKKEIEIPVYIVNRPKEVKEERFFLNQERSELKKAQSVQPGNFEQPKMRFETQDEALPTSQLIPNLANVGKEKKEEKEKKLKLNSFGRQFKLEDLSIEKRKTLMWVLVVFFVSLIFLGWLTTLKYNLSRISLNKSSQFLTKIQQEWTEMPKLWKEANFKNDVKQNILKSPNNLSQEEINKLKEKILEVANEKEINGK